MKTMILCNPRKPPVDWKEKPKKYIIEISP